MAVFEELDWSCIDVWAIAACAGIVAIEEIQHDDVHDWLKSHRYQIETLDCGVGLSNVVSHLGKMFRWEEQFGYALDSGQCNLNALRDGFNFDVPDYGGQVFELVHLDKAWHENPQWFSGLLAIAQEYSRWEIAMGRRFFTMIALASNSSLIGKPIETSFIPHPFKYKTRN